VVLRISVAGLDHERRGDAVDGVLGGGLAGVLLTDYVLQVFQGDVLRARSH
jgi:hypothetical protein